jgi:hypothetical protein
MSLSEEEQKRLYNFKKNSQTAKNLKNFQNMSLLYNLSLQEHL